jgi:HEAT repeat protein
MLQAYDKSPELAKEKFEKFSSLGTESLESLLVLLENNLLDTQTQAELCWILGKLQQKDTTNTLVRVFNTSSSPLVWWEASKALASINSKRSIPPLITALSSENNDRRSAAIYALSYLGDTRAVQPLLNILNNTMDDPIVRGHAAESLAAFFAQQREIMPHLLRALNDTYPEVRFWSAFALGQQGNMQAIPALQHLAATDTTSIPGGGTIQQEAADAIAQILQRNLQDEG